MSGFNQNNLLMDCADYVVKMEKENKTEDEWRALILPFIEGYLRCGIRSTVMTEERFNEIYMDAYYKCMDYLRKKQAEKTTLDKWSE